MIFTYNGKDYEVDSDSIYKDIIICTSSLEDACAIVESVSGMTSYVFNLNNYNDMVVQKMTITLENDSVVVRIKLREQTDYEKVSTELSKVRNAISDISISDNDAQKHPCLFEDITQAKNVVVGQRYVVNGKVQKISDVIDEPITDYVQRMAKGGK